MVGAKSLAVAAPFLVEPLMYNFIRIR